MAAADYAVDQYVYFSEDFTRLTGSTDNFFSRVYVNSDGSIVWSVDSTSNTPVQTDTNSVPVDKFSLIRVERVANV